MNQLRERFGTFLARARSGALPSSVDPADAPPAEFLAPATADPGASELTVHYADADLAVISGAQPDGSRRWGVFGVDPFRDGGIAGVPLDLERPVSGPWSRERVLEELHLHSWLPLSTVDDSTLRFDDRRRVQGWVGVRRITFDELEDAWEDAAPDRSPIIRNPDEPKEFTVGNQTFSVEAAGELNCPETASRHVDPTLAVLVRMTSETRVWVTGEYYDRRCLTFPYGIYRLYPVATQAAAATDDSRCHRSSRPLEE